MLPTLLTMIITKAIYFSLPIYLVKVLGDRHPTSRYYTRLLVYISTLSVCSVWGVAVSVFMTIAGQRFDINFVVARSFALLGGFTMGITFEVEGEEHLGHGCSIMVGNHQSMLDILYLGRIFPRQASIMAKQELKYTPFLGQYMSASGAVFINRSSNKDAVAVLAEAGKQIKERAISLWMFPEGTRHLSKENTLLPFKKGAFHLAVQAGIPIIPVVCQNYWHLYHPGVLESGKLKIVVLSPVPTSGMTSADVPALVGRVEALMTQTLRVISDESHVPPTTPGNSAVASVPAPASAMHHADVPGTSRELDRSSSKGTTRIEDSDEDAVLVDKPTQ